MLDRVACMMTGQKSEVPLSLNYPKREKVHPKYKVKIKTDMFHISPWSDNLPDTQHDYNRKVKEFTDAEVLARPPWADPSDTQSMGNQLRERLTYEGPIRFEDGTGRPLNPRGRTGLRGRGKLGRWGPNHAVDLLLTRDHPVTGKLQIVVVKREDATEALNEVTDANKKAGALKKVGEMWKTTMSRMSINGDRRKSTASLSAIELEAQRTSSAGPMEDDRETLHSHSTRSDALPGLPVTSTTLATGQDVSSASATEASRNARLRGITSTVMARNRVISTMAPGRTASIPHTTTTWAFPGKLLPDNEPFRFDAPAYDRRTGRKVNASHLSLVHI